MSSAFKITPATYDRYLEMDLGEAMEPKLELRQINNAFIVRDDRLPNGVGWFMEEDFREYFDWVDGKADPNDFAPIKMVKDWND